MMFTKEFWKQVQEEVEAGYINVQKHPTEDLWIYNYSQNAMFDGRWNEATMHCRGLIVDENKNVIAFPLKKFMTKEQCESFGMKIPYEEDFEVMDKVDGSMGILYFIPNVSKRGFRTWQGPFIATRGSFSSIQALEATKILKEKYPFNKVWYNPDFTYIFEIIYPDNRIVVDYGNKRDLILLAIIETATGREIPLDDAPKELNVVTRYHGLRDFSKIIDNFQKFKGTQFEGLVIKFKSGFRVKIKTEDYKRLHKILSGINSKRIWECLSSGQGLQEIMDVVDDSFADWVKQVEHDLIISYNSTEGVAKLMFKDAWKYADIVTGIVTINDYKKLHRKNFAKHVMEYQLPVYRSILFQMYGNMEYEKLIWESIKPNGDQKFKVIEEE
jgi:putative RNA ligase